MWALFLLVLGGANQFSWLKGSTWMTEGLSAGKYPEYKVYQKRVSRFLPLPPDETIPWKSDKGK